MATVVRYLSIYHSSFLETFEESFVLKAFRLFFVGSALSGYMFDVQFAPRNGIIFLLLGDSKFAKCNICYSLKTKAIIFLFRQFGAGTLSLPILVLAIIVVIVVTQIRTEYDSYKMNILTAGGGLPNEGWFAYLFKYLHRHQQQQQQSQENQENDTDKLAIRISIVFCLVIGLLVLVTQFLIPDQMYQKLMIILVAITMMGMVIPCVIISRNPNMSHYCGHQIKEHLKWIYIVRT